MLLICFCLCYNTVMDDFNYSVDDFIFSYETHKKMDPTHFKKHMHAYYEMLYLDAGEITYVIEDKSYNLKEGNLILIDSAYYHFVHSMQQTPYKRYMIQFTDDFVDNTRIEEVYKNGAVYQFAENAPVPRLIGLLAELWPIIPPQSRKSLCQNMLNVLLSALISQKAEDVSPPGIKAVSKTCQELNSYINSHLTSLNNLDDLANHFYFSKTYLNHLFKKEMNISVMQFIRNKKILLAQKLIRAGRKPTEVYEECGFTNYVSFYRAYCRFLGESPSARKHD